MRPKRSSVLWIAAVVVACGLATQAFAPHEGDEGQERVKGLGAALRAEAAKEQRARAARLNAAVHKLANPRSARAAKAFDLCREMFALSEDQTGQMDGLAAEREERKEKLLTDLDKEYAGKARGVLTPEQQEQLDVVTAALEEYRKAVERAVAETTAIVGETAASRVAAGDVRRPEGLIWLLDLTPDQRKALGALIRDMSKAEQVIARPADPEDREAMRDYHEAAQAAREKTRAEFAEKQRALLTPGQKEELAGLEVASKVFKEKVEAAREEFLAAVKPLAAVK